MGGGSVRQLHFVSTCLHIRIIAFIKLTEARSSTWARSRCACWARSTRSTAREARKGRAGGTRSASYAMSVLASESHFGAARELTEAREATSGRSCKGQHHAQIVKLK